MNKITMTILSAQKFFLRPSNKCGKEFFLFFAKNMFRPLHYVRLLAPSWSNFDKTIKLQFQTCIEEVLPGIEEKFPMRPSFILPAEI